MLWVCLSSARTKEFFRMRRNWIELKHRQNSKGKPASQQTLGDKFTFQQDNNLKHKGTYTLEFLTKMTLNVSEWYSYSFGLNWPEYLWQELKMAV
jgi:hypothetical protein